MGADRYTIGRLREEAPHYWSLLHRDGAVYIGPTIVQAKGAWCRVGPTWHVPTIGFCCVGPEAREWMTKEGLAELASNPKLKPVWHAIGAIASPMEVTQVAIAVLRSTLDGVGFEEARRITEEVEDFRARGELP